MKNQGFTLVEFTIYIVIVSIILTLTVGILWNILSGNIKETSHQEVQQNGRFALLKISREIKKANGINNPLPGDPPADSLSLSMTDPSLNPTIFDVFNGKLRIRLGLEEISYDLTSDRVIVSNLQFINLSYPDTPGLVRIEMVLDHINPGNRTEYRASIDLKSSVSLMPGGAAPVY